MIEETGKCDQLHNTYRMQIEAQKIRNEKLTTANANIGNLQQKIAEIRQKISYAKSNQPKFLTEPAVIDAVAKSQNNVNEAVQMANLIADLERELSSLLMLLTTSEKEALDLQREVAMAQANMDNIASEIVSIGCKPV